MPGCVTATQSLTANALPTISLLNPGSSEICTGSTLTLTAGLETHTGAGSLVSYYWAGPNGFFSVGSSNSVSLPSVTTANTGTYSLSVTYSNKGCTSLVVDTTVTIDSPYATVSYTDTLCAGSTETISFSAGTGSVPSSGGLSYSWVGDSTTMGLPTTSGSGALIAPYTVLSSGGGLYSTETFTVTPSVTSLPTCHGPAQAFAVTVYSASPTASAIPNDTVCNNAPFHLSFAGTATSYSWTNSAPGANGLGASYYAGAGYTYTLTPSSTNTVNDTTALISVIPNFGTCAGAVQTFNLVLHPTPTVATIGDQVYCVNTSQTISAVGVSSSAITTYDWSVTPTPSWLAALDTASIETVTVANGSMNDSNFAFTITPVIGNCAAGTPTSFNVTVHPMPTVTLNSDTLCNGALTTIATLSPSSNPAITTLTWTSSDPSLVAGGSGSAITFTPNNSSTVADSVANLSVQPTIAGCPAGAAVTMNVTVHPTPTLAMIAADTVCSGNNDTKIFAATTNFTDFNWTLSNGSYLTLGASGSLAGTAGTTGTTATIGFSPVNTDGVTSVSTFTITPVISVGPSCTGATETVNVLVRPRVTVTNFPDTTYCFGTSVTLKTLNSIVTDATTSYAWYTDYTNVVDNTNKPNFVSSIYGQIPAFTATDTVATGIDSTTFYVLATANGCTDTNITIIRVNPNPVVNAIPNYAFYNGQTVSTDSIMFSGASETMDTNYVWTIYGTGTSLATTGMGHGLPAFSLTNTGTTTLVDTVIVTPYVGVCSGQSKMFTISIYGTPGLVLAPVGYLNEVNDTFCNNTSHHFIALKKAGLTPDSISKLVITPTSTGIFQDSSLVSYSSDYNTVTLYFTTALGYAASIYFTNNFTVTPYYGRDTIQGAPFTFALTVAPTPVMDPITNVNQYICDSFSADSVYFTGVTGTGAINSYMFGKMSGNAIDQFGFNLDSVDHVFGSGPLLNNLVDVVAVDTMFVYPFIQTGNYGKCVNSAATQNFYLHVMPIPRLAHGHDTAMSICGDSVITYNYVSNTPDDSVVNWMFHTPFGVTTHGDSLGKGSFADTFYNASATGIIDVVYYSDIYLKEGCIGRDTLTVHVYPKPTLNNSLPGNVCNNAAIQYYPTSAATVADSFWVSRSPVASINPQTAYGAADSVVETLTNTDSSKTIATIYGISSYVRLSDIHNNYSWSCRLDTSFTVRVRPTAKLNVHADTVCSEVQLTVGNAALISSVTDTPTVHHWVATPATQFSSILSLTATGNTDYIDGSISTQHYLRPQIATYIDSMTIPLGSTGVCLGVDSISITVNPRPGKPVVSAPDASLIYAGSNFQNFKDSFVDNTVHNIWSAYNAQVVDSSAAHDATNSRALVTFNGSGFTAVIDEAFVVDGNSASYGCYSYDSVIFNVRQAPPSVENSMANIFVSIIAAGANTILVCDNNQVNSYLWGYDNASTFDSTLLLVGGQRQINQDFQDSTKHLDMTNNWYWVMTVDSVKSGNTTDVYIQKTYLNGSYHKFAPATPGTTNNVFKIFPNPAHDAINVVYDDGKPGSIDVEIFDLMGNKIKDGTMANGMATVSVNDLPNGTFILACFRNGIKLTSTQIIKN